MENGPHTIEDTKQPLIKNKKILISGAGIAGLSLAYWLKRYGFEPTIVEKHPTLRTGGYKIDIRGVAIDVIKRMNVHAAIFESRTDMQGASLVDDSGNYTNTDDSNLVGARISGDLEIVRGNLCKILFKQIPDVECLFGDSITQISQNERGVDVKFAKNQPRLFDLVIGADGLHSNVRRLVFGEESDYLKELGLYVSFYTVPNFLQLDRHEIEYHHDKKFAILYSSRGDVNAIAGFVFSKKPEHHDLRDIKQQQKILGEAFADSGWEIPRLLEAMKDTPDFYFDIMAQTHMPYWTKGRVALIGDAGYSPAPVTGQGTSLALVGAYVLAGELAEAQGDYEKAFSNYEKVLRDFVKTNQDIADMSGIIMKESSFLLWLHHLLMRLIPETWARFLRRRVTKASRAITLKNYPENSDYFQ